MQSPIAVCLKCCTRSLRNNGYCELCDEYTGLTFTSDRVEPISRRLRTVIFKRMDGNPRSGVKHTELCVGPAACTAVFAMCDCQYEDFSSSAYANYDSDEESETVCKAKYFKLRSFAAVEDFAR